MSFAFTFLILVGGIRSAPEPRLERSKDAIGFETLAEEISEQAPEFTIVYGTRSAAKPARNRGLEERAGIDVLECLGDGAVGDGPADARGFYFLTHPESAAAAHVRLGAGNRLGDTLIVQRALGPKLFDRRVDFVGGVAASAEPLPHLRL
jgi:hypothetical protein